MNIIEYVYLWICMILLANRSNVSWNLNFSSTVIWSFYPILSCNFETCELPRGFSRNPCTSCTRRSDGKICRSSLLPWDLAQPPLDCTFLFSCSVNQEAESTPKIGKKKNRKNGRTFSLGLTSVQYCVHATLQVWHPGWDMVRQRIHLRKDCHKCQQTKQMILQQCRDKTR